MLGLTVVKVFLHLLITLVRLLVTFGIPLLIPGERFNRTIVRYLQFVRDFNSRFPGFETDCHGLVRENIDGEDHYFVDVVINEEKA